MIDVVGSHPFSDYRRVLTPDATYVLIGHDGFGKSAGRWVGSIRRFLKLLVLSPFVSQNIATSYAEPDEDSLNTVRVLLETGRITPIVGYTYPLAEVPDAMRHMVEEAAGILLGGGDFLEFGRLLHEGWMLKRSLTDGISTPEIEEIYASARRAGAIGGKLLGAGGGGFMLFFVKPQDHSKVLEALGGLLHVPFSFEPSGSEIIFDNS